MPPVSTLPRSAPETQGVDSGGLADLVQALADLPELHSLMVLRHGHVVAEAWAHPYGPDMPHELFSLSKSFTSTAVGLAAGEGLLDVDDLLLDHLGDRAPANLDPRWQRLRLRHLLTMTTGHDGDPSGAVFGERDWVAAFLAQPLTHEPGTHFVYNTAATYVLSAVVQRVTGQRLLDYLTPRLLDPLGIGGATWEQCPMGVDTGGFGLSLRTADVAAFGQLLLQDGVWDGTRLLPEGWVAEATRAQVSNGDPVVGGDWWQGYGYQFWRCRHGGYRGDGAFGQLCVVLPDQDVVVAATSAVAEMQPPLDAIWTHLLPALHDGELPDDPPGRARLAHLVAGLRLDPPAGEASSPAAERLAGRVLVPDNARWAVRSVTLEPGADHDVLTMETERFGTLTVTAGHGEPHEHLLAIRHGRPERVLVSAVWTDPTTYVVTARFVESPFVGTVTARVLKDRVDLESRVNVGFDESDRLSTAVARLDG